MEDIIPKQELYKILKSKSLRGVAPSTNDFKSFFNNRSFPIVLSTNNKFWADINNDLILKTGKTYSNDLGELRNYFREIERFYSGRDLSKELPDIEIGE